MLASDFFTLVITVPETHSDALREAMGLAGAGDAGGYSHCSFTYKGTGRFMPKEGADPFIGKPGALETVQEEKIETICHKAKLDAVIDAIKKAHPYEETVIDIFPIYQIGLLTR